MRILELSKVIMYELRYVYFKNKYYKKSKLLFTDADSVVYKINVYEDFISDEKTFDFTNYSTKSKYCDNSNKLVIGKMKDETGSVAIVKVFWIGGNHISFLVHDNSEYKKAKCVNKIVLEQ